MLSGAGVQATWCGVLETVWLLCDEARQVGCVEFALHPQHEMSLDSGIQLIKDFNYFKSKSKKRPRSLSMVSLNSSDWEEYWNTKVIPQDDLKTKRMKVEQTND